MLLCPLMEAGTCMNGNHLDLRCQGMAPCELRTHAKTLKPGSNIKQCLFPGLNNLMARQAACTKAHPELWAEAKKSGLDLCNTCGGYDHDNFDWANPSIPVKGAPKPKAGPTGEKLKLIPVNPADLEINMTCTTALGVCAHSTNGCERR